MDHPPKSQALLNSALAKSVEHLLDQAEFETLLADITLVGNVTGHAEPNTKRTPSADFNPRSARIVSILAKFSPRPHLNLFRSAVLATLEPSARQSGNDSIDAQIAAALNTPLGQHFDLDCETLALAWLLDDTRHLHLQLDSKAQAARIRATLADTTNSRFPENSKLFTFVRAALDRYERFS